MGPSHAVAALTGTGAVVSATLEADFSQAGYGVGTWLAATTAQISGRDKDTRELWKDWRGITGGAAGFGVWLSLLA